MGKALCHSVQREVSAPGPGVFEGPGAGSPQDLLAEVTRPLCQTRACLFQPSP